MSTAATAAPPLDEARPAQPAAASAPEPAGLVQAALCGSSTCVWEWDVATDLLSDIHKGAAMLGWAPGSVGQTQAGWSRLIHPDDLAASEAAFARHARGETDTCEHSYRARTPFQRGAQARGLVDGAGIGLSVTQALVALMGGRVRAHSRLGEGSRFTVALPPPAA